MKFRFGNPIPGTVYIGWSRSFCTPDKKHPDVTGIRRNLVRGVGKKYQYLVYP
jgi:hypothetical protein